MNGDLGSIAGRVIDATGAPVAGATVAISSGPGVHSDIAGLTNADGRFFLGSLAPGQFTLAVHGPGQTESAAQATVAEGQQAEVEIRLDGTTAEDGESQEVALVTDAINWTRVRLVRVTLEYASSGAGDAAVREFFFSPANNSSTIWRFGSRDQNQREYTVTVVYFMNDGLQKTVGPNLSNDHTLLLDPQS